jgi:hypothetical protein
MATKKPGKELLELLGEHDAAVVELYLELSSLVVKLTPEANEIVYDAGYTVTDAYSFNERWQDSFCMITIHRKHVNLGLTHGAALADPERRLRGKGKQYRHIQVRTADDLKSEDLLHFLNAAIEHARNRTT